MRGYPSLHPLINNYLMNTKKFLLTAAVLLAAVGVTYAQGNGQAGITEATNMITSYFDPGTKLVLFAD